MLTVVFLLQPGTELGLGVADWLFPMMVGLFLLAVVILLCTAPGKH